MRQWVCRFLPLPVVTFSSTLAVSIGAELRSLGVGAAQFFTNALDTETLGLDVVLSWSDFVGGHRLRASLAGNFNEMELGAVRTTERLRGKEEVYFGRREQHFLLASAPPRKITAGLDDAFGRFDASARVNHYGRIVLVDWLDTEVRESRGLLVPV